MELLGTTINERYKVVRQLGQGGMGVVYLCEDGILGRQVAIKFLSTSAESRALERFRLEAQALGKLKHNNVLEVMDFGEDSEGRLYLVMEYVPGGSLKEYLQRNGTLAFSVFYDIVRQLCAGIAAAHEKGILHRDIKPANVMVAEEEEVGVSVKLLDFGVARYSQEQFQTITSKGAAIGSPPYMSPEVISGDSVDHRSDMYSLGCLMYELLGGRPPFLGENALDTMMMHVNEEPDFQPLHGQYPPELVEILAKCLEKNPDDRYGSVDQIVLALEAVFNTVSQNTEESACQAGGSSEGHLESPLFSKRILITASSVLAISILAGTICWYYIKGQKTEVPPLTLVGEVSPTREKNTFFVQPRLRSGRLEHLIGGTVTVDSVRGLSEYKNLRYPRFEDTKIDSEAASGLVQYPIVDITFDECILSDGALEQIAKIPRLEKLELITCRGYTPAGLEKVTNIRRLDLLRVDGSGTLLSSVSKLNQLTELSLEHVDGVPPSEYAHLADLKNLTYLEFSKRDATREIILGFLDPLTKSDSLRRLSVYANADNETLGRVSSIKRLRFLNIGENSLVDDAFFKTILNCKNLVRLRLKRCPKITEEFKSQLSKKRPKLKTEY